MTSLTHWMQGHGHGSTKATFLSSFLIKMFCYYLSLCFIFSINYLIWRLITLQYCHGVLPVAKNMNWPQVYMCPPHPEPLSHLPPHPILPGCFRALAFSALLHALNLHWSSILHMAIHMFQCYPLKSSHPRLLPLSPKICSLYLCFLCCPACMIICTIFLNFIYMC